MLFSISLFRIVVDFFNVNEAMNFLSSYLVVADNKGCESKIDATVSIRIVEEFSVDFENWMENADNFNKIVSIPVAGGVAAFFEDEHHKMYVDTTVVALDQPIFDSVFRNISSFLVAKYGLLLHSSGVIYNNQLWLFSGPSGCGKSTIAGELRGKGIKFTEDNAVLRFDDDRLVADSTPFSSIPEDPVLPATAPVAGIVFIEQADVTEVSDISTSEAIQQLYYQTRYYERDAEANQRFLDVAEKIVNTGLCCKMRFKKDTGFWPLLEQWRQKRLVSS